jgi:hypothetical protein
LKGLKAKKICSYDFLFPSQSEGNKNVQEYSNMNQAALPRNEHSVPGSIQEQMDDSSRIFSRGQLHRVGGWTSSYL